jgi:hypothetical protein
MKPAKRDNESKPEVESGDVRKSTTFIVGGLVVAAAASGYAAAWKLSVIPVKDQLERQVNVTKQSPVITDVRLSNVFQPNEGLRVYQSFSFHDPEGDANAISFVILQTNKDLSLVSETLKDSPKERQIAGDSWRAPVKCEGKVFRAKIRVYMADAGGHVSLPVEYEVLCPDLSKDNPYLKAAPPAAPATTG